MCKLDRWNQVLRVVTMLLQKHPRHTEIKFVSHQHVSAVINKDVIRSKATSLQLLYHTIDRVYPLDVFSHQSLFRIQCSMVKTESFSRLEGCHGFQGGVDDELASPDIAYRNLSDAVLLATDPA